MDDAWSTGTQEILTDRRMKTGKRRFVRHGPSWPVMLVLMLVLGGVGAGVYRWLADDEPSEETTIPQTITAAGAYRAAIGTDRTITIGLEVSNQSTAPVSLLSARLVAPAGLTNVGLSVTPAGEGGFQLAGDLPASQVVELGPAGSDQNAVILARFMVDCQGLLATGAPTGEEIFVTVRADGATHEEQLTPPAVDTDGWLVSTAQRSCLDPVPTDDPEQPLPPLPADQTPSPEPTS